MHRRMSSAGCDRSPKMPFPRIVLWQERAAGRRGTRAGLDIAHATHGSAAMTTPCCGAWPTPLLSTSSTQRSPSFQRSRSVLEGSGW